MRERTLDKMLDIGARLSAEKDYGCLLEGVLSDVMTVTGCEVGAFYREEGDALRFLVMRREDAGSFQGGVLPSIPLSKGHVCALAMLDGRTICVDVREPAANPAHWDAPSWCDAQTMAAVPVRSQKGRTAGVLQLINARDKSGKAVPFAREEMCMVESITSMAAVAIENMQYVGNISSLFHSFVQVLSKAIDERTPYNAAHTRHMVRCGERFIEYLNRQGLEAGEGARFSPSHKDEFLVSVWLHDIGKLVTPLEVMNKVARLTPQAEKDIHCRFKVMQLLLKIQYLEGAVSQDEMEERAREIEASWQVIQKANESGVLPDGLRETIGEIGRRTFTDDEGGIRNWLTQDEVEHLLIQKGTLTESERKVMESHVSVTSRLLEEIDFSGSYGNVPFWASSHHELLDGSGYPNHLKGEEIPGEVRIMTILDIFDALTADDRPYKPGIPVPEALSVLRDMAEKEGKLDLELVKEFIKSRCWEEAARPAGIHSDES